MKADYFAGKDWADFFYFIGFVAMVIYILVVYVFFREWFWKHTYGKWMEQKEMGSYLNFRTDMVAALAVIIAIGLLIRAIFF